MGTQVWTVAQSILRLQTPWLSLIGERLRREDGESMDYWRVEKVDSVIVLPIHRQQILLPPPSYRPGLGVATLDLPGGRCPAGQTPAAAARSILMRELGLEATAIAQLTALNHCHGWPINSSFSNQRLYGFVAQLQPEVVLAAGQLEHRYPVTPTGLNSLYDAIQCLQCRLVLREWQALWAVGKAQALS